MLRNYMLIIAYDGTRYYGWQMQKDENTVQNEICKMCKRLFKKDIRVTGSSRTDAGVHADYQVAAIQVDTQIPIEKMLYVMNQKLPKDICIKEIYLKPMEFHPIFDTKYKEYEYLIYNCKLREPKYNNYMWHYIYDLNVDDMKEASEKLIGEYDFKAFCSSKTVALDTVRTIYDIDIQRKEKNIISIKVKGSGFLHNMVRIITGTLVNVGRGLIDKDKISDIIRLKDRKNAGPTAPACGLTLKYIKIKECN